MLMLVAGVAHADGVPAPGRRWPRSSRSWAPTSCTGTGTNPTNNSAFTYRSRLSATPAPDLGGFWIRLNYQRAGVRDVPAFVGAATIGWDAGQKKYVFVGFDNLGGMMSLTSSAGPAAGSLVFEGQMAMGDQKLPMKVTLTAAKGALTFLSESGPLRLGSDDCK